MEKTCVIIPAFNEAAVIGEVIGAVKQYADTTLVIDDGSTDQTADVARRAGATVLRHLVNRGQGAAIQTGITAALRGTADIIITFDADGQFLANEIGRVIDPIIRGQADVVLGSRFLPSVATVPGQAPQRISYSKKTVLKVATAITRLYTGLAVTDTHNGFRALSRQAARLIELRQNGMAHASEILEQIRKYDLRVVEVPVTVRYTEYSVMKGQKLSGILQIIWDLLMSRFAR